MAKLTEFELEHKLHAFANALGLSWYHHSEDMGDKIEKKFLPTQLYTAEQAFDDLGELSERVEELHSQQSANIQALRKDLRLLLEHLGLELNNVPKQKVIVKKGKK